MPLNNVRFLDDCADRILLRRVGGGYIFIHRTFMEHVAGLDPDAPGRAMDPPRDLLPGHETS
jgi:hypothetical protein